MCHAVCKVGKGGNLTWAQKCFAESIPMHADSASRRGDATFRDCCHAISTPDASNTSTEPNNLLDLHTQPDAWNNLLDLHAQHVLTMVRIFCPCGRSCQLFAAVAKLTSQAQPGNANKKVQIHFRHQLSSWPLLFFQDEASP